MGDSYTPATLLTYHRALQKCFFFLSKNNLSTDLPIDSAHLALYLAYLKANEVSLGSIKSALTAISWRHKTLNFSDPCKDFNLQRMLVTYAKNAPAPKKAAALTLNLLEECIANIPLLHLNSYDALTLKSVFLCCYYGCLRIGEACLSGNLENVLKAQNTEFVTLRGQQIFKFTLTHYKHSREPATLAFAQNPLARFCPVKTLREYALLRPKQALTFFARPDASPVKRIFVASQLAKLTSLLGLDTSNYSTHSIRAGRATDMAEAGEPDAVIRSSGRLRSDAFKCYLRFDVLPAPKVSVMSVQEL